MKEIFNSFLSSQFVQLLAVIADASIIIAVIKWIYGITPKVFKLESTGKTYKVKRKDFNVQTVTNGVAKDENLNHLPENIRNEIIQITKNPLKIVPTKHNAPSETEDKPS